MLKFTLSLFILTIVSSNAIENVRDEEIEITAENWKNFYVGHLTSTFLNAWGFTTSTTAMNLCSRQIVTIDSNAFSSFVNLIELNLCYNNLTTIPSTAFSKLNKINQIGD